MLWLYRHEDSQLLLIQQNNKIEFGWGAGAGHYRDLTEIGNRARKVSGTQGSFLGINYASEESAVFGTNRVSWNSSRDKVTKNLNSLIGRLHFRRPSVALYSGQFTHTIYNDCIEVHRQTENYRSRVTVRSGWVSTLRPFLLKHPWQVPPLWWRNCYSVLGLIAEIVLRLQANYSALIRFKTGRNEPFTDI